MIRPPIAPPLVFFTYQEFASRITAGGAGNRCESCEFCSLNQQPMIKTWFGFGKEKRREPKTSERFHFGCNLLGSIQSGCTQNGALYYLHGCKGVFWKPCAEWEASYEQNLDDSKS